MSKLDILAFNALDAKRHLLHVSNDMLRELVHTKLSNRLEPRQLALYDKLLKAPRSRYVASFAMDEHLEDDYLSRYSKYRTRSAALAIQCVDDLLRRHPLPSSSVRAIVTNTTVGGTIPNLSSVIGNHLGLGPTTKAIDLGYMGCATALLALELIEGQLKPGEIGLVLSSELTSVMVNLAATSDASLVANTVFGDGVGAFLVAKRPHSERALLRILDHAGSLQTGDDALAAVTYEPNPVYHEIRLHDSIPEVAARGVRQVLPPLIRRHLASWPDKLGYVVRKKIPHWQRHVSRAVLHTAGSKVLEGLTQALELERSQVEHNFRAFQQYGNTSSASLYYALDELHKTRPVQRGEVLLFLGYGSGFMVRGALMEGQ